MREKNTERNAGTNLGAPLVDEVLLRPEEASSLPELVRLRESSLGRSAKKSTPARGRGCPRRRSSDA